MWRGRGDVKRGYRGLVVGFLRAAAVDFAAGFFAVDRLALAVFFFVVRFGAAAVVRPGADTAPEDTRLECFTRWRTFFGAASAADAAVNAISIATSSRFIVVRTIERASSRGYDNPLEGVFVSSFRDRDAIVRDAIYAAVVEHGVPPPVAETARATGIDVAEVDAAYRALADAHVIVLQPSTSAIAWAPPFSGLPTAFRTTAGAASWYAPCAWDAFGIMAALARDGSIDARCAWSGEALSCGVASGRAYGDAVIHLLVPAAHFWDDIFFP